MKTTLTLMERWFISTVRHDKATGDNDEMTTATMMLMLTLMLVMPMLMMMVVMLMLMVNRFCGCDGIEISLRVRCKINRLHN